MSLIPTLLIYHLKKSTTSKKENFKSGPAIAVGFGIGFAMLIPFLMILNIVFLIWALKLAHRCRKYGGKSILHYVWAWFFHILYIIYAKVSGCSKVVNRYG